jgi:hypothetical protein
MLIETVVVPRDAQLVTSSNPSVPPMARLTAAALMNCGRAPTMVRSLIVTATLALRRSDTLRGAYRLTQAVLELRKAVEREPGLEQR